MSMPYEKDMKFMILCDRDQPADIIPAQGERYRRHTVCSKVRECILPICIHFFLWFGCMPKLGYSYVGWLCHVEAVQALSVGRSSYDQGGEDICYDPPSTKSDVAGWCVDCNCHSPPVHGSTCGGECSCAGCHQMPTCHHVYLCHSLSRVLDDKCCCPHVMAVSVFVIGLLWVLSMYMGTSRGRWCPSCLLGPLWTFASHIGSIWPPMMGILPVCDK